ncbi:MAG: methionine gamma-lyase family protein [Eubacteriales bacterium]|nr:methionine gamma-lyase family protein [Eubacteriales bacterium]
MSLFIKEIINDLKVTDKYEKIIYQSIEESKILFNNIEEIAGFNQYKILKAFQKNKATDFHLNGSTGYGYGDTGRETLEEIYKDIFKAEKAIVRSNIVSGTHALAIVLFGLLKPGDSFLSISGTPYDTLLKIIGKNKEPGTLSELNINHDCIDLTQESLFDFQKIAELLKEKKYPLICIQRSKGYSSRKSILIDDIKKVCQFIKEISPETIIFIDNCYGEFVETQEPIEVGADIIAGSLIKNPGGGLALRGGYVAGKEEFVLKASYRLTAPGIHEDVTSALDFNRTAFQGLFISPLIVEQALKGAIFSSTLFSKLGFETTPSPNEKRTDIVQGIILKDPELLKEFCNAVQSSCPLDSFVRPTASQLPGYDDAVIMAGGTFIQGSSIELSVDGPMRDPYTAYLQGGLSFYHVVYAAIKAGLVLFNKDVKSSD